TDQGPQFESHLFHSLAKLCGIQLSRTTAHHPAANGLVEHFHRTLKAAIMCHADQHWTEALPLVLLGIRTAFKEGLQGSVAELVYGEPLSILGELLTPTADPVDPAHLITQLRQYMARLRPIPATRHASPATFVHSDLEKCTHVFLRQDTTSRSLKPPYSGPYQVLSWKEKTMQILVRGRLAIVSPDTVKPANMLMRQAVGPPPKTSTPQPTKPQPRSRIPYHHSLHNELHASDVMYIILIASTAAQRSPRWVMWEPPTFKQV
ncbi:hypothetical protein B7P43_G04021, partial [Cryptotermes secundus]